MSLPETHRFRAGRAALLVLLTPFGWLGEAGFSWAQRVGPPELTPLERPLSAVGFLPSGEGDREGVAVYEADYPPGMRVAGEGCFSAPPDLVRTLLLDYEGPPGHIGHVQESRILERGPNWLLAYQRLRVPVVADRDYVLLVWWDQAGPRTRILFSALRDRGPGPRPGVVRVTGYRGSWQLELMPGGGTFARLQVRSELAGGAVVRWAARSRAGGELVALFRAVRGMIPTGARVSRGPGHRGGVRCG